MWNGKNKFSGLQGQKSEGELGPTVRGVAQNPRSSSSRRRRRKIGNRNVASENICRQDRQLEKNKKAEKIFK